MKSFLELTEEMRLAKVESLRRRSDSSAKLIEELTRELFQTASLRNEFLRLKEDEQRMQTQVQDFRSRATSMDRFNADEEQLTIIQLGGGDPRPVGPNRPYLLSMGLALGALGGLLLAVLRSRFRGPRDPGSPGALTPALPVIARG